MCEIWLLIGYSRTSPQQPEILGQGGDREEETDVSWRAVFGSCYIVVVCTLSECVSDVLRVTGEEGVKFSGAKLVPVLSLFLCWSTERSCS